MAIFVFIAAIGLIGAMLADNSFAPPFGAAVGALAGIASLLYARFKDNVRNYTMYVKGGLPGGYVKQDSRFVLIYVMAIMGAISAFIWQLLFFVLK